MTVTPEHILVVDDEAQIRRLIMVALKRDGYDPVDAETAAAALAFARSAKPVAALVDLGLPDRDGLELVAALRQLSDMAIIVVSARDTTEEKITALDLGADDYITKPFSTDEVLARLRAALRRRLPQNALAKVHTVGDIVIDEVAHLVYRAGREVHLTPKEYALLLELARHHGKVLTHAHLLRTIWGPAHESDIEYLRVTTRALRLKLESDPARPQLIRNEPGVGYRMSAP